MSPETARETLTAPGNALLSKKSALHSLPIEIWRLILRLATTPFTRIEAQAAQSGNRASAFGWQFSGDPDPSSLATKVAIALTCSYLWTAVSEYLYEIVTISSTSSAQALLWRISEDVRPGRIIVSNIQTLIFNPRRLQDDESAFRSSCIRLASLCRNVTSLKYSRDNTQLPSGAPRNLSRLSITLLWKLNASHVAQMEELDIHDDFRSMQPKGSTYPDLLNALSPKLRKLRLAGPMSRTFEGTKMDFPSLTHLAIMRLPSGSKNVSRILNNWTFHSLTHLYIDSYMRDENAAAFWSTPRPSIVLLHLGESSLMMAQIITNATPNLEELEFVYTSTWGDIWNYELPTKLKHVTVQTYTKIQSEARLSSSLFIGSSDSFKEKFDDLISHIQPFINPRQTSLKTFTLIIPPDALRELNFTIDSIALVHPGVIFRAEDL